MKPLLGGLMACGLIVGLPRPALAQYEYITIDVPGATTTFASAINDFGQIVGDFGDARGSHGFFLDVDGSYTTLDVPGWTLIEVRGINNAGQIVGDLNDGSGGHGRDQHLCLGDQRRRPGLIRQDHADGRGVGDEVGAPDDVAARIDDHARAGSFRGFSVTIQPGNLQGNDDGAGFLCRFHDRRPSSIVAASPFLEPSQDD